MRKLNWRWIAPAGVAALSGLLLVGYQETRAEEPAHREAHAATVAADAPVVTLYKNPSCHCCAEWGTHLEENGFRVKIEEGADLSKIRAEHGVSDLLASCHTAVVDGYVLEGHVPADLVRQLLTERPELRGLAVPGMPAGVPGMPAAGPFREKFPVMALQADGSSSLYAER